MRMAAIPTIEAITATIEARMPGAIGVEVTMPSNPLFEVPSQVFDPKDDVTLW